MTKLWGGRFTKPADKTAEGFTSSLAFDRRLYKQDIRGSIAHVRMLGRQGIIPAADAARIEQGLREIEAEIEAGQFPFRQEYEDIHLNIEKRLIEKIGPAGGRLHTARSRNDQVVTDVHLWVKDEIAAVQRLVSDLQGTLLDRAREQMGAVMPGYTHLQRAQPVLLSHHLMAYFWMLERDYGRFADALRRADVSPLGAGALAGTTFPIDREFTAAELGFAGVYPNSMDAVSDRDFIVEFVAAAAICQMHLSRLAEELVMWSSTEFGFVEMDDAYATGSSIMPQKKNPDVAELVRGKTGRIYGDLMALLTVLKGLPLAYHTDLQEDKERLFDAVDTLKACLTVMTGMLATLKFNRERMAQAVRRDFSNATDMADYLVKKGMPFREAHEVVGKAVLYCVERGKFLADLTLEEFKAFSALFEADIYQAIAPETCVSQRTSLGGTAPAEVERQLALAAEILSRRMG
ncbi:argininosuccinate lyase [Symbiobacterium thermophilum]|uniref:Argininosuccinate lyase n=1 Tax=Symbiobacterium thermophilum (strain DSM 24528 / JCM 14929 / IAM 14863 / T) TaxID=292459 RepID=ARLY_SYMTH|nr:argininosuccinate lyase [Symbiobacterium thermophilum]Q67S72.1 RecName: Full=Argininosuccinate lyase; Short=ASAL; AltName: Full=Arginosuccinase [Symbiobacterium thermophilum IAM 14863]BAD39471.1 argininosuccinate lyase [Symbiobacterium thermophilum IAM 14863]